MDSSESTSYEYFDPVNSSLECAICRQPFLSPSMSPSCQHIFCHHCITRALLTSKTCPIDRSPLREEELVEAPRIVRQMVGELKVRCANAERGCERVCERALLEGHLRECGMGEGKREKGKQREIEGEKCELCGEVVATDASRTHSVTCSSAPTTCLHCSTTLPRSSLPSHFLLCPLIPIPCPHASHGCPARLPRSLMVEDHLEVSCAYEPIKDLLLRYDARIEEVESENRGLRVRVEGLEEGMRDMREWMEGVRNSLGGLWVEPIRRAGFAGNTTVDDASTNEERVQVSSLSSLRTPSSSPTLNTHPFSPNLIPSPPQLSTPSVPAPPPTSSAPLPTFLATLSQSIQSLSSDLSALDARQHSSLLNETLRIQDDVQSVRGVLHGVRMQMHYVLMELGRAQGGMG
ncbi:hypothetical protein P7C70_g9164, partial [Phenoliferia sp. Uapishka_3]